MEYEIACRCGKVLHASEAMAGWLHNCECGETIPIPSLGELRAGTTPSDAPPAGAECQGSDEPVPAAKPIREVMSPTRAWLRVRRGEESSRQTSVMVALTTEAVWIEDGSRLRTVPLHGLVVARPEERALLTLTPSADPPGETLNLTFAEDAEAQRWHDLIQSLQPAAVGTTTRDDRPIREGPVLLRTAPELPYVDLGRVECTYLPGECADQAAQLRAGLRGADAVIEFEREKCPELGAGAYRVRGRAVRVEDDDARTRLRGAWYNEQVSSVVTRMLLLVVIQGSLLFFMSGFLTGKTSWIAATGETPNESLKSAGLGIAIFYGWPLLLVILLGILRWRELLGIAALAVLAVTTVRGLAVVAGHLAAIFSTGVDLPNAKIWMILDPVDWAFIILGMTVFVRARRLARQAREMFSLSAQGIPRPHRFWSRSLATVTGAFVLMCLVWSGIARYDESAQLLQPGVDPVREQKALLAFNKGVEYQEKGLRNGAEKAFLESLHLWEQLTEGRTSPATYRANLALTLFNLSTIYGEEGKQDEAEAYLKRCAALADGLVGENSLDKEMKEFLAATRKAHTARQSAESFELMDQKDQEAQRNYEEAQVTQQKDAPKAIHLYREAIDTWEEILPRATNQDYRRSAFSRLALAYLHIAELQSASDQASKKEASLKKAIEYGEKAVEADPTRPLPKHNLDLARRSLAMLQDRAFQEEIGKLDKAGRFAEIINSYQRSIQEQETRIKTGKDPELPASILAHRLDRLAWFLAHCPVKRLRDTKASVEHARRAATLKPDAVDYWYTLAMVQYRNGDWRDSLATLESVKAKQGEFQAEDWLLSALNLHRLDRKQEAREARDQALAWIQERNRKAENDPALQYQNQMMWPTIESLLREVRGLLDGAETDESRAG
jgi:tetratricopeptide (TPR) repeat protein